MPLIDLKRHSKRRAWTRWRGLADASVRLNVPTKPAANIALPFSTPPQRRVLMPSVSLTSKPTAYVKPPAPPVSPLGLRGSKPRPAARITPVRAQTQYAPAPTPGVAVFGTGLTPANGFAVSDQHRAVGGRVKAQSGAAAAPVGVPYQPAAVASQYAPSTANAAVPTRGQHMSIAPSPMMSTITPTYTGNSYTPGVPQQTQPVEAAIATTPTKPVPEDVFSAVSPGTSAFDALSEALSGEAAGAGDDVELVVPSDEGAVGPVETRYLGLTARQLGIGGALALAGVATYLTFSQGK